jgi:hypothetical protein
VDKISKLSKSDREELGWESPQGWDYDNETLAARMAKLKKRDGEVENLVLSPEPMAQAARASPSSSSTPISGTFRSARGAREEAKSIL